MTLHQTPTSFPLFSIYIILFTYKNIYFFLIYNIISQSLDPEIQSLWISSIFWCSTSDQPPGLKKKKKLWSTKPNFPSFFLFFLFLYMIDWVLLVVAVGSGSYFVLSPEFCQLGKLCFAILLVFLFIWLCMDLNLIGSFAFFFFFFP